LKASNIDIAIRKITNQSNSMFSRGRLQLLWR